MGRNTLRKAASLAACLLLLSACETIPADSIGTLDRARDGELVVGVSEHHPWTDVSENGDYSGSEIELWGVMILVDGETHNRQGLRVCQRLIHHSSSSNALMQC